MSSDEESPENRQNNEFEALKSIFSNDLEDKRKKAAWNKWQPMNISIRLGPLHASSGHQEAHVSVELQVQCSPQYPRKAPEIQLQNGKGLSNALLEKLKHDLMKKAKELEGQEMIYQLSSHVQEFLSEHNKPGGKSFYDEMVEGNRMREQNALDEQRLVKDREAKSIQEELKKLRSEQMKVSFNLDNPRDDEAIGDHIGSSGYGSESQNRPPELSNCETHRGVEKIKFDNMKQVIQRGSCIRHVNKDCVLYRCFDENGATLCLTEWIIQKNKVDVDHINKKIVDIQNELNNTLTRIKHDNLCSYVGFQHKEDDDHIFVYVLTEYVQGTTCSFFIGTECSIQLVRHIAGSVIAALNCLHRNDVVHRDLTYSCVHIADEKVKVGNHSIYKKVSDLVSQTSDSVSYSKKADIYKFGILVLSLLNGSPVKDDDDVNIPTNLPPDLYDFLQKCLCKKQVRSTAKELSKHKFLHSKIVPFRRLESSPERTHEEIEALDRVLKKVQVHDEGRIKSEFDVLELLGKGAFGYVFKAKNKLDGNYYAVKIIQLKAKEKTLIRKILREVKLLSRLNHENIVRYYNSWIEASRPTDGNSRPSSVQPSDQMRGDSDQVDNSLEQFIPEDVAVVQDCQSESVLRRSQDSDDDDEDEEENDEDEDDENISTSDDCKPKSAPESSESIVFQDSAVSNNMNSCEFSSDSEGAVASIEDTNPVENESPAAENGNGVEAKRKTASNIHLNNQAGKPTKSHDTQQKEKKKNNSVQNMYIQMEFCEKSTLRTEINNGLHKNVDKVWILFREIVEGIAYIHEQGMMHRDLKPDNIFLDSKGHVKIGDFGLATHIVNMKLEEPRTDSEMEYPEDEKRTGALGTPLYVAPELTNVSKANYNEKVDIYSLGIILFEMFHPPLTTGMERIKIISALRNKEILFPEYFEKKETERQRLVIRWLLNHDTTKRPTAQELLKSEHLPPPALEERKIQDLVRHTLSNSRSKMYKNLISACFQQDVTGAQDLMYDQDPSLMDSMDYLQLRTYIEQTITNIFKQHGGIKLTTTLLIPKSKFYENDDSYVKLMSHNGGIVALAHDLRIPFARYIAWHKLISYRRYTVERTYREEKIVGFHPLESWEAAFDIVAPLPGNLLPDAEILYIMYEVLCSLQMEKNCLIKLNHTALFDAILLQYGIFDKKEELVELFSKHQDGIDWKSQLEHYLINYELSNGTINHLLNFFNTNIELSKSQSLLQQMKKKLGRIAEKTGNALEELNTIIEAVKELGANMYMVLAPGLLDKASQYQGMMCQVVCNSKKKHKNTHVLASGGRYDAAVDHYRQIMIQAGCATEDFRPGAVGISISLDKLCHIKQLENEEEQNLDHVDVIVCSIGRKSVIKDKMKILKELWAAGIRSSHIECKNEEEVLDNCSKLRCRHVVVFRGEERQNFVVYNIDKDRMVPIRPGDKSVKTDLIDTLYGILKLGTPERVQNNIVLQRTDSKSCSQDRGDMSSSSNLIIHFMDKVPSHIKRRAEIQISNLLESLLRRLKGVTLIVALDVPTTVIETLGNHLNLSDDEHYHNSVKTVIEKNTSRLKKNLQSICESIYLQSKKHQQPLIILYSINDVTYKIML